MRLEQYQLEVDSTFMAFEFISEGPKGKINKLIMYSETDVKGIYNLSFGDRIGNSNEIDDLIVTDNKDSEKVLATVVASIYTFTNKYPQAWVILTGSTKARTRLYRMGISIYFEELNKDFFINGYTDNKWVIFDKNINFEAFSVKRKLK
jgi:hypothetical protein